MVRPELSIKLKSDIFLDFYWLKTELVDFCRVNNLPTSGRKDLITRRIAYFLDTGNILQKSSDRTVKKESIVPDLHREIPIGYKNDEVHRAFFKEVIGEHFKFNVAFMNWMKGNPGKLYSEAVDKWQEIEREKRSGKKTVISSQFQYNQYTRDFFEANKNLSREDAIKCWKYKKSIPGHNRYEDKDLVCL